MTDYQPNWNDQPLLRAIDYIHDCLSDADRFPILFNRTYVDGSDTITCPETKFHKNENYGTLQKVKGIYRPPAISIDFGIKTDGEWLEGTTLEEMNTYIIIDTIFSARTHALASRGCIALDQNVKQAMKIIRRFGANYINWIGFVFLPKANQGSEEFVIRSAYEVQITN